mgnify:CR=1 FL=1|jgi:hypothetical protein
MMTDSASKRDAIRRGPGVRRQHAPADVAPELYDTTDELAHETAVESQ